MSERTDNEQGPTEASQSQTAHKLAPVNLGLVLFICCLGQFMVVLDASIVNVALPDIQHELNLSGKQLQWVINAYTVIFAGFLLVGGRLADLMSVRKVFVGGTILFGLASLAAGLAQNPAILLVSRAIQGLGGAILAPATLTILFTSFTDQGQRMKAFGSWSAAAAGAGAVGALLGGVITQWTSWRWVFLINVPIALILVQGALRVVRDRHNPKEGSADIIGATLITAGLMAVVYGLVQGSFGGWNSTSILFLILGFVLCLAFILNEGKLSKSPLVPLGIFKNRSVSAANLISMTTSGVLIGVFYLMTLLLQFVYGTSPLMTGFAYVPMALAILLTSRWAAPHLLGKIGPRPVLVIASLLAFGGLLWLSRVTGSGSWWLQVVAPSVVFGLGQGLTSASVTTAGTTDVPYTMAGLVSGLLNASRQIGGALLLAVLVAVAGAGLHPGGGIVSYQRGLFVGSLFPIVGLIAAIAIPRKEPKVR
ncbi:MFS transporter [Stomatohabitans albus]|uniref:MFS transporter n=1 Tax=Stomatohabitans albus TaxID=3110766 RepID=UPI00300BFB29